MEIKNLVEGKLIEIWEKYKNESFTDIPPLSVSEVPDNSIIFIGINPSISETNRNKLLNSDIKIQFYNSGSNSENHHKYFQKFIDISKKVNKIWGHIDLLYIQETNQRVIEEITYTEKGLDFIYQQLLITKEVIDKIITNSNPLVFVVNNSLARKYLGKDRENDKNIWIGYDFTWDEKIGTYRYQNIPFFFSSMLTGQRALDIGSYERLIWQINKTIENT